MAAVEQPSSVVSQSHDDVARLKQALLQDIRRSCYVYRVDCGGCNGCEIEIFAAITPPIRRRALRH